MNNESHSTFSGGSQPLLDELLRMAVPEIKLALGELIDRENARPLPPRYARLLPESLLVVTLRPDAAQAVQPIAGDLERELTDSCTRHGSLYDRNYRVRLQRSADPGVPLYTVAAHAGRDIAGAEAPVPPEAPSAARPAAAIPEADDDATRIDWKPGRNWEPGRWLLVVEGKNGEEREVFTLGEPMVTIGRRTDDAELRSAIAISDAPHVSRRQLALVWEARDGAPGFKVYNLGLNGVYLPNRDLTGARVGRDLPPLDSIAPDHVGWVPPGVPIRIGDEGPLVRIEELPPHPEQVAVDPDATVFG